MDKYKKSKTIVDESPNLKIPDLILKLFAPKDHDKATGDANEYLQSILKDLEKDFVKQDGLLGENILSKFICIHSLKEAEAQKFVLNSIVLINLKLLLEKKRSIANTFYLDFKNQLSPLFISKVITGFLGANKKEMSNSLLKSIFCLKISKDFSVSTFLETKLLSVLIEKNIKYLIFDSMQSIEDLEINEINGKKRGFDYNSFFESLYIFAKKNSVTVIFLKSITLISKYENGKDIRNFKKGNKIVNLDEFISDHLLIERLCFSRSIQRQPIKERSTYNLKPIQSNVFGDICYYFDNDNIVFQEEFNSNNKN